MKRNLTPRQIAVQNQVICAETGNTIYPDELAWMVPHRFRKSSYYSIYSKTGREKILITNQ